MPAIPSTLLLNTLITRSVAAANATSNAGLHVVCAWPVSGQYGPGSRILYYVLIAACVFARKAVWIRNACLAAALLFPAVAALHGIVLAAVHVDGAVDMDVYGAFQLCSIGILAGPVAVRLSRTYFNDPGRNAIFVWTILILAGLLSLIVEFLRTKTSGCTHDDSGKPISMNAADFPYNIQCGLTCSVTDGPVSPLRHGSANNIYVIPAPDKLTFHTATLLAAACCIPAILSLISMWIKILEVNWKTRFGDGGEDGRLDVPIEGTNGATAGKMRGVNNLVSKYLSAVEVPLFGAAVLAVLIMGERNFFSRQVRYQTEPIASIGQWAPIVGTGLAVLGSLYLLLAADLEAVKEETNSNTSIRHSNCSMHEGGTEVLTGSSHSVNASGATDMRRSFSNDGGGETWIEITSTTSRPNQDHSHRGKGLAPDAGNRRKVAKALSTVANYVGNPAHDRFDDSEFKRGKAVDFPEIPGEEFKNINLPQIRTQYNHSQEFDRIATSPLRRQRSRSGSFTGSVVSDAGVERTSTSSISAPPLSPQSSHSLVQFPSPPMPRRPHTSRLSDEHTPSEIPDASLPSTSASNGGTRPRRDTLEVPPLVHHRMDGSR